MSPPKGVVLVLAGLLAASTGCSDGSQQASVPGTAGRPAAVRADLFPPAVHSLRLATEDISSQAAQVQADSYVSDAKLWSLREGSRLRATVQVSRFTADAPFGEREFQQHIVAQIGSSPRIRLVSGHRVYASASNDQLVFVWFRGAHFVVFSVAADYPTPRVLLRKLLEAKP